MTRHVYYWLLFVSHAGDWGSTPYIKINIMKNTMSNSSRSNGAYPELIDCGDYHDAPVPVSHGSGFLVSWVLAAVAGFVLTLTLVLSLAL